VTSQHLEVLLPRHRRTSVTSQHLEVLLPRHRRISVTSQHLKVLPPRHRRTSATSQPPVGVSTEVQKKQQYTLASIGIG